MKWSDDKRALGYFCRILCLFLLPLLGIILQAIFDFLLPIPEVLRPIIPFLLIFGTVWVIGSLPEKIERFILNRLPAKRWLEPGNLPDEQANKDSKQTENSAS